MSMLKVCLLIITSHVMLCPAVAYDPPSGELDPNDYMHIHYCYLNGMQYRFAVSNAAYEKLPDWTPETGTHPPITPKVAMDVAHQELQKIKIGEEYFWRFEHVSLEPVNTFYPERKWMYRVVYRYAIKGFSTGVWPTMEYIVTMEGKLVTPHISKDKKP
jgi:hypothetical protein